jgi:hypothetical protein
MFSKRYRFELWESVADQVIIMMNSCLDNLEGSGLGSLDGSLMRLYVDWDGGLGSKGTS